MSAADFLDEPSSVSASEFLDSTSAPVIARAEGPGTVYGLNVDGSVDRQDNGRTFAGDNSRDPRYRGVAIPRSVAREVFGSEKAAMGQPVRVTNLRTGLATTAPIGEIGPSEYTGNVVDLSFALNREVGGDGKDPMRVEVIGKDAAGVPAATQPAEAGAAAVPPAAGPVKSRTAEAAPPVASPRVADMLGLDEWRDHEDGTMVKRAVLATDGRGMVKGAPRFLAPGEVPSGRKPEGPKSNEPVVTGAFKLDGDGKLVAMARDSVRAEFSPDGRAYAVAGGQVLVDPKRFREGWKQALDAGVVDAGTYEGMMENAPWAEAAAAEHEKLMAEAGKVPELKAALRGAGRGAVALAAAKGGAVLGSRLGPIGALLGGVGGMVSGGLAYDKLMEMAKPYSETVAALEAGAKLQPKYAATGELVTFALPVPGSLGRLAAAGETVAAAKGSEAAAKYVAGQVAGGAGAGAGVDVALQGIANVLGVQDGWSPESTVQNALLGGALSGHGVKFRNVSDAEVGDILRRGISGEGLASRGERDIFEKAMAQVSALRAQGSAGRPVFSGQQVEMAAGPATVLEARGNMAGSGGLPAGTAGAAAPVSGAAVDFERMAGMSRAVVPVENGIAPVRSMGNAGAPVAGGTPVYVGQQFVDRGGPAPMYQGGSNELAGMTPLAGLLPDGFVVDSVPPAVAPEAAEGGVDNGKVQIEGGSQEVTAPARRRGFSTDFVHTGYTPLMEWIATEMPIRWSRSGKAGGENDDLPGMDVLKGFFRMVYNKSRGDAPDTVAQAAYEAGLIKEPSVSALAAGMQAEAQTFRKLREEERQLAEAAKTEARMGKNFAKDVLTPAKSKVPVPVANLQVGAKVKIGEEEMTVTDIDPESFAVTLQDGKKYGLQEVQDGKLIFADEVIPPDEQPVDFPDPEPVAMVAPTIATNGEGQLFNNKDLPFNLQGEVDLTPELQRAADAKAAARDAQAAADRAQGDMFAGGMRKPVGNPEAGFADIGAAVDAAEALGRRIYLKGMDFARWAREMLMRAGKWIADHLHTLWRRITGQDILPWARERGAVGDLSSEPIRPVSVYMGEGVPTSARWIVKELGNLGDIRPGAMPEMVRLARELSGKVPDLRKFSRALGKAYTAEGNRSAARIALDPRIFVDPSLAARVLAHEVGHLVDSFDEATLKRGNILGRLGVLREFLGSTLPIDPAGGSEALSAKDRQRIRRAAEKAVGGRPAADEEADLAAWRAEVSAKYREMVQEEMEARGLAFSGPGESYLPNVREELIGLTDWWSPFLDKADQLPESYLKYRMSSRELYAEFVSVLLNNPEAAKLRAPVAWEMFFNNLDKKPDAKRALFELWDWMNKPKHERMAERRAGVLGMFRSGAELMGRKIAARERLWTVEGFQDGLRTFLDTRYWPIIKRERAAAAAGNSRAEQHVLEWFFDEHPLADNAVFTWLTGVQDRVRNPLMEAGLTEEDLGEFLFWDRIAREDVEIERVVAGEVVKSREGRATLANPQGHTKETALEGLEHLEVMLGSERFARLRELAQVFHDEFFKLSQLMREEGMISDEAWQMVEANRDAYAAFVPLEYADVYVSAGIRRQIGTLKDIANPWVSTVLKGITTIRAIEMNRAKRAVVAGLGHMFPDEVRLAKVRFDGNRQVPVDPKDPDVGLLLVGEGGRRVGYEVPADVAEMFEREDHSLLAQVVGPLDWAWRNVFYPIFITYNPVFQFIRNPIRDTRRTALNLPPGAGVEQAVVMRLTNARAVRDFVERGVISPEIAGALEARAIVPPMGTWQATSGAQGDEFLAIARRFGLAPEAKAGLWERSALLRPVAALGERIRIAGQVRELVPKLGTYRLLTENLGWGAQEAAFFVRNNVGTPNYTKQGTVTRVANAVFPFTNVFLKGWQADLRLMRKGFRGAANGAGKRKSAASWWLRWMLTSGSLRVLQAAGAAGLLGAGLKQMYDRVGDYWMSNYDVLPIGETDGGSFDGMKTAFVALPRDPTDRILSALVYTFSKAAFDSAMGREVDAGKLVPKGVAFATSDTPGVNPVLKIAEGWRQFAAGQNPHDSFRAAPVLSQQEMDAGGWPAVRSMLVWSMKQTGVQTFAQYDPASKSSLEIGVGLIPGINGLVKVTDNGLRERIANDEKADDAARARASLSMPDKVLQLRRELNYLRSVGADRRSPSMELRFQVLSEWNKAAYEPAVEAAQQDPKRAREYGRMAEKLGSGL